MAWGDLVRTINFEFDDAGPLLSALTRENAPVADDLRAWALLEWRFEPHYSASQRFAVTKTNSASDVAASTGANAIAGPG